MSAGAHRRECIALVRDMSYLDCTYDFGDDRSERHEQSARKERYPCRSL